MHKPLPSSGTTFWTAPSTGKRPNVPVMCDVASLDMGQRHSAQELVSSSLCRYRSGTPLPSPRSTPLSSDSEELGSPDQDLCNGGFTVLKPLVKKDAPAEMTSTTLCQASPIRPGTSSSTLTPNASPDPVFDLYVRWARSISGIFTAEMIRQMWNSLDDDEKVNWMSEVLAPV